MGNATADTKFLRLLYMYRYFSSKKLLKLVEAPLKVVLSTPNYCQRRKEVRTGVIPDLLPN